MNLKRLKALTYKESLQVFRDPSSILIAFILPLILLFLMGYAVSGAVSYQKAAPEIVP
jgi:ABC-2 type transport system permease protein